MCVKRGCRPGAGGAVSDEDDGKAENHCGAIESENEPGGGGLRSGGMSRRSVME
ncbi:MAG: hypothetical protein IJ767_04300 [Bacteroidaceae bacterium]|nr:hypothetical protein [Bacteroidaceae bacterium]